MGIGTGNRTLRIRDAFGITQDALAVVVAGNVFPGYPALLQEIQAEGQWRPFDCRGAPCDYDSSPSAADVSVDWSDAFYMQGRGVSVARYGSSDSDMASDWHVGASSFGVVNP